MLNEKAIQATKFIWSKHLLILLTWRIWWAPNNASRWQMGFNSAFEGLIFRLLSTDFRCLCLNLKALCFMYWGLTFGNSTFCPQNALVFILFFIIYLFILRTGSDYSIAELKNAWISTSVLSCLYGAMFSWLQTIFKFTLPFISRLRLADQMPCDRICLISIIYLNKLYCVRSCSVRWQNCVTFV